MAILSRSETWYRKHATARRRGEIVNGVGHLPLTQGKVALLDPAAMAEAEQRQWTFSHGYALRNTGHGRLYLHHFVLWLADDAQDAEVDHINGNGLDNRIANLRWVDRWQNQVNRRLQPNNTSGYRGVTYSKGKWAARLKRKGEVRYLGAFATAEAAGQAYDEAAKAYGGGVVRLNFEEKVK